MARYRGPASGKPNQPGTAQMKTDNSAPGSKRADKRRDSDVEEEDDLTSSNGHSGNEMHVPAVQRRPNSRKPGINRHLTASSRQKAFALNKIWSSFGIVIVVGFVAYYGYLGYLETRISTPLPVDKVVSQKGVEVSNRFWGSYRPGVYFGMKHRSPKSLLTGLMWLLPSQVRPGEPNLRHLCQQGDNLKTYGWLEHDGVNFGVQEIVDHNIKLTTSFVKKQTASKGGDWTSRIEIEPMDPSNLPPSNTRDEVVILFYVALEPGLSGTLEPEFDGDKLTAISGNTSELGSFVIKFINGKGVLKSSFMQTTLDTMNAADNTVLSNMATSSVSNKWIFFLKNKKNNNNEQANFLVYQIHVKGQSSLDIVYQRQENQISSLSGGAYTKALEAHRLNFDAKFESTFHLDHKGFNRTAINFAKAALSNMVGGIGYFYGHSRVQSILNSAPVPYWTAGLYASVPSRSFFPRGFLWDEGFHLMLINKWDPEISIDIISHWLDLMNTEGWIPREQILGDEALSRVPDEFVVQRNDVANPPTLIMALFDMLHRHREWLLVNHKPTLHRMWPRLSAWYQWLNKTQVGEVPFTYRWRGRNATAMRELNPKTLASGLDDYPRASHPTDQERHVDLRCWMAISSKLMGELAEVLGYDSTKFVYTYDKLTDPKLLDKLHWSDKLGAYADYGFHSDKVALQYPPRVSENRGPQHQQQQEKIRYVIQAADYKFVNMFGYVSLFPMILQILKPDSPHLLDTIKKLDNPKLLWTPYGLRSLAANAPLYSKRNTEHDPPYWRGAVWININFLTLKSLKYYSTVEGPSKSIAKEKYEKLRSNIISNVINEYYKSGYIWEQYDDSTGSGKGCRPFTGWSALVVLMMSEEF